MKIELTDEDVKTVLDLINNATFKGSQIEKVIKFKNKFMVKK